MQAYSMWVRAMLDVPERTIMERIFVWAGGAIFVASLSLTAWWYAVRFGQDRPLTGWTALAIDALLLTVFAMHHSLFARASTKAGLASLIPARLLRSVYVWFASALLILVDLFWQPVGATLYDIGGWSAWLFAGVQIAGVGLIARSVQAIDPLELAGIRNPKMTDEELQTGGVYRLVRHPIYFGWVLIVFGAAHMTGDRLAFAVLTTAYLVMAMPWEERSLEREFGAAYRDYKQHVRWKIVPYVY
jgi:protein-S-isoprenylcysteine O-methyltransferase Ste14